MKYHLSNPKEHDEAFTYLTKLAEKEAVVEVKRILPVRSLNQNNYLHLLLGAFGQHFGYELQEAKLIYKEINKGIYAYGKKGRTFYRSSADLNKEDMAKTIDAFMRKSSEQGYDLPLATDQEWLRQISNEIERSKYYL